MGLLTADIIKILGNSHLGARDKIIYISSVLKLRRSRSCGPETNNIFGFKIKYSSYDSFLHIVREIFINFCYFVKINKTSPVIFDVGSNIGIATLFFKSFYPDAVIYSFEPDPDTFSLLDSNIIQNNLTDILRTNAGLSDFDGKSTLYVPHWSDGSSSILQEKIEIERGYASQCFALPESDIKEKEIDVVKCSDFIRKHSIGHIDLLKIDAEGSEESIINDLIDRLDIIDFIVMEFHFSKDLFNKNSLGRIVSVLERADFIVSVMPSWFEKNPQVMCTYIIRAVNGKYRYLNQDSLTELL